VPAPIRYGACAHSRHCPGVSTPGAQAEWAEMENLSPLACMLLFF
jgi:hypothetical protein